MIDGSKIISELEALDEKLLEAIKKILGANPTKEQLLRFLASEEFDKLINDLGLEGIVKRYVAGFSVLFAQGVKEIGIDVIDQSLKTIGNNLELIKATNERTILGYFGFQKENFRKYLISSIVDGQKFKDIAKSFGSEIIGTPNPAGAFYQGKLHIFSEPNVKTVIGTSYYDYDRSLTRQAFLDKPDQRFHYGGLLKETSSNECEWLVKRENQKPEGYTMAEIDEGIETPFIYQYGGNKGEIKKIYWWGRQPNYNCPHTWRMITDIKLTGKYDKLGKRII